MKHKKLTLLMSMLLGSTMLPALAQIQDDDTQAGSIERIAVTGSRLRQVDMEGASPVTVIQAESIRAAGFNSVGEALRASNFNAFGSWGGGANNSWASQSTISMKGAGANRTLILLDGQRMAKSPVMDGGSTNLNTLPMSAVERIEILSDGASAVYGTDAMAGVINIILKKDYDGSEFTVRQERTSRSGGGDSTDFSFTSGLSTHNSNFIFTWDHKERNPISMASRAYEAPYLSDNPTTGWRTGNQYWYKIWEWGRTIERWSEPGGQRFTPLLNAGCDAFNLDGKNGYIDGYRERTSGGVTYQDEACLYDHSVVANMTSGSVNDSILMVYNRELGSSINMSSRIYWANNRSTDTSAAVSAAIRFNEELPTYTTEQGLDIRGVNDGDWILVRFDQIGPREAKHTENVMDFSLKFEGDTSWGFWEADAQLNRYHYSAWGTGYMLGGTAIADLVGSWDSDNNSFNGWDPRDPHSPVPGSATANIDKFSLAHSQSFSAGTGFDLLELPGGFISAFVGAAYRKEKFLSDIDGLTKAGRITGGSGGAGGEGERTVSAVYAELGVPVLDELSLTLAGRYDRYSDFGSTFNPQLGLRYTPLDSLLFRASFGRGFRAPTLADINKESVQGWHGSVINYPLCVLESVALEDCNLTSAFYSEATGNKALKPERSKTWNIGTVWDISDNLNITADFWHLEIEDEISSIAPGTIALMQANLWLAADEAGVARPDVSLIFPNTSISYDANNYINGMVRPTSNFGFNERRGLDIKLNHRIELLNGTLSTNLAYSRMLKYRRSMVLSDGNLAHGDDLIGSFFFSSAASSSVSYPAHRATLNLSYALAEHAVTLYSSYIHGMKNEVSNDTVGSYLTHNLSYQYQLPWNSTVNLGVNNLADKDPVFDRNGFYDSGMNSIFGRSYYLSYTQRF
ncbi:TonB-dependent receptor [Alkalimonas sp.]|uniref:TonB-dependent receptor domain-containing protein n=1 Tax=Alkalimonas sp. TaxID=1872453 RepID=UPI00263BD140|nr:TonB-dependent receptor [Alkalimonas sp.]MCC5826914.1 TonB-dependent receptor [Alkalimonas sp.]